MKIYTRTGDTGMTGLLGGGRVSKAHARIKAIGALDESNAALGAVFASGTLADRIQWIQCRLFDIGAELAGPLGSRITFTILTENAPEILEAWIDEMDRGLPLLKTFILPGGSACARALHVARGVIRRAEQNLVELSQSEDSQFRPCLIVFLNRLSDWAFTAARYVNFEAGVAEVPWKGDGKE